MPLYLPFFLKIYVRINVIENNIWFIKTCVLYENILELHLSRSQCTMHRASTMSIARCTDHQHCTMNSDLFNVDAPLRLSRASNLLSIQVSNVSLLSFYSYFMRLRASHSILRCLSLWMAHEGYAAARSWLSWSVPPLHGSLK